MTDATTARATRTRVSTGIDGLDEILHGGLIPSRSYLVRGKPGTGKTILGLHYLTAGVENDETTLFVNLEEPTGDIERNAEALGISLDGVHFLDLSPDSGAFVENRSYDVFAPDEVEGETITDEIVERIESVAPDRVFVDPLTQLRYLTPDEYQFRKQVIGLMDLLTGKDATVLFTSQDTDATPDDDLRFLSDGIIELDQGKTGRRISVPKFPGSNMASGESAMCIRDAGIEVFPQLVPGAHDRTFAAEPISSAVPEIDELLNGGLERGTVTVISGPTGVGKTTTGTQFMKEAAGRGERSVIFMFEEAIETFRHRSHTVNIPIEEMMENGSLEATEVEALDRSPEEFGCMVKREVEERDAEVVMIDGIDGYRLSLRGNEDELDQRLHALCRYLKNRGVTVILIDEVSSVTGEFRATEVGISYVADNIIFLRHLELQGELRKAIGVLKKRVSDFERTLREFEITEQGIEVGEPLDEIRGILTGTPEKVEENDVSSRDSRRMGR